MRIILPLVLGAAACGMDLDGRMPSDPSEGKLDDSATIIDQDRDDITVIRAAPSGVLVHPSLLGQCLEVEQLTSGLVRVDCTEAIDALVAQDVSDRGILAHRFLVLAFKGEDGSLSPPSSGIPCQLTRIETASRSSAIDRAESIGFYFSGSSRPSRALSPLDMEPIGTATGRDGQPRTLHELYAALPCWQGTASSSQHATYEFKPFMIFTGSDGTRYRNWDGVPRNYLLTGGAGVTAFDRSSEVLQ
jgi:hypothetical protein